MMIILIAASGSTASSTVSDNTPITMVTFISASTKPESVTEKENSPTNRPRQVTPASGSAMRWKAWLLSRARMETVSRSGAPTSTPNPSGLLALLENEILLKIGERELQIQSIIFVPYVSYKSSFFTLIFVP
eukprot:1004500_1